MGIYVLATPCFGVKAVLLELMLVRIVRAYHHCPPLKALVVNQSRIATSIGGAAQGEGDRRIVWL